MNKSGMNGNMDKTGKGAMDKGRDRVQGVFEKHPSGAKAHGDSGGFAARLKSCPDAKPGELGSGAGVPSGAEAPINSAGFVRGLKPPPPSVASFPQPARTIG